MLHPVPFPPVPPHWPYWIGPGCSVLGLLALLESYLSLTLTHSVAVAGHSEAPPAPNTHKPPV